MDVSGTSSKVLVIGQMSLRIDLPGRCWLYHCRKYVLHLLHFWAHSTVYDVRQNMVGTPRSVVHASWWSYFCQVCVKDACIIYIFNPCGCTVGNDGNDHRKLKKGCTTTLMASNSSNQTFVRSCTFWKLTISKFQVHSPKYSKDAGGLSIPVWGLMSSYWPWWYLRPGWFQLSISWLTTVETASWPEKRVTSMWSSMTYVAKEDLQP